MLKLLYFGIFSSTAKTAEFPEYKCLDEWNSTVFQARTRACACTHTHTYIHMRTYTHTHIHCLYIILPVPLIKITWGQRKYMQIPSNLVIEWVKQKPDMVING